ncbi:hypothetical protein Tco_0864132 [Tanacetum coccineum]
MPVYDTDIEDFIEEEEGFVGKGGFGGEEDNTEDVVVVAKDLCSSMIQTIIQFVISFIVSGIHWNQQIQFVLSRFFHDISWYQEPKFLRSEGEELEYPFFEGDSSSSDEWGDYSVADYEGPPVFDDDQFEDELEEEEGFVGSYPNFQEDENNVSFSGGVLGVEEESMLVYDIDIEDVIEEEEGFVGKEDLVGKKTTPNTL